MRSVVPAVLLFAAVPFSTSAIAHDGEHAPAPHARYDTSFSPGDWAGAWFVGTAGGALGGLIGGGIGLALAGSCVDDSDDDSLFGDCFLHGVGETAIGGIVGATFGGAAGIYAYGELTGHSGSYWAAAGGMTLGLIASGGIMALSESSALGIGAMLFLPALGGTAGYVLSLDDGGDDYWRASGGLIDIDRGQVRLSIPEVNIGLADDGGFERIDVHLLGARF